MFTRLISECSFPTMASCIPQFIARHRGKRLAAGITTAATVSIFVFLVWSSVDDTDTRGIELKRPHLMPSNVHESNFKISQPQTMTKTNMANVLPDDISYDFTSPKFLQCYPGPILKQLNAIEDLTRYSGCRRLFYNRVPKCGSRTILSTIRELSQRLNYTVTSRERQEHRSFFSTVPKLVKFGHEFSRLEEPFVYSQHIHFVNFTQLGIPPPMYINVVREPLERVLSHYFYSQYGSNSAPSQIERNFTLDECVAMESCPYLPLHHILPYFCGQSKLCRLPSQAAVQEAKSSLRTSFLVVGITEDIPAFLEVAQTLLPQFFSNATNVFLELKDVLFNKTKTVTKPYVKPETRQALKDLLPYEYDFYEYARQRFYTVYNKIMIIKGDVNRTKRDVYTKPRINARARGRSKHANKHVNKHKH